MNERARDLVDKVLPHVRVRQWVLSLPFDLRWRLAFDHRLSLALLDVTRRAIQTRYRRLARKAGLRDPQGGSVSVIQRCSSDLRTNVHFHILTLDGAYGDDGGFFTAPAPSASDVQHVLTRIVRRAAARLAKRDDDRLDDDDRAVASTYAHSE